MKLGSVDAAWGLPHTGERFGLTKVHDKWAWQSLLSSESILKVFLYTVDIPNINSLWCHLAGAVFVVGVNSLWAGEGPSSIPTYDGSHSSNERSLSHSTSVVECKKCRTWQRRVLASFGFRVSMGFHGFPDLRTLRRERFSWGQVPVSPLVFTGAAVCSLLVVPAAKAMSRSNPVAFCFSATCPHLWVVARCLASCDYPLDIFGHNMMFYNDTWLLSSWNLCLVALDRFGGRFVLRHLHMDKQPWTCRLAFAFLILFTSSYPTSWKCHASRFIES